MALTSHFVLGQFRPGAGLLYYLDPRTKLLAVLAIMVHALIFASIASYAGLIVVLGGLLLLCGLSLPVIVSNMKPVAVLILITALFHFFFSGHDDPRRVFELGGLSVSVTAIRLAVLYSERILIFLLATFILTLTTDPVRLSEAIVTLLTPLKWVKIPIYDLGMILFIALRFIPVLSEEAETIRKAQKIRGISFEGGLIRRTRRSLSFLVPIFFASLRRADELAIAIDARGYQGGRPRSSLYPLRFGSADAWFAVATVLVLSGGAALSEVRL